MFKKIFSGLLAASIIITSCVKHNKCDYTNSSITAPSTETQILKDTLFGLAVYNVALSPSGFYYVINNPGTGASIGNLCSTVSVSYKGTFLNDSTFDSTAVNQLATFQLGQVILGWQQGLPLINKGGEITLYIPPTLAYGPTAVTDNSGNVLVPGNSYLKFDINLVDIQ